MMEFPIDTAAGDIPMRRSSYLHSLDVGADGRSDKSDRSTRSSAKRDENGAIILQFPRRGSQVLKLGADVDELEQERLLALMDDKHMTWRHRWFSILEGRPHEFDETLSLVFNILSFGVVIISCIVFSVASVPEVSEGPQATISLTDPLFWIEAICIFYFMCEAVLRCVCVPIQLLFTPLFIIDLVTIAGFFTDFFAGSSVSFLRVLRLLRVFRVMKISRYSRTLQLVFKVFAQSASGLSVLLMPIFLVVITAATILYFIEVGASDWNPTLRRWVVNGRPAMFQSIFDGIWFTMATITTIGYGDFVPMTLWGKIIAGLLALFGVLTLSFPNLVLGANLESAFALHKKDAARTFLSKRFRKVWLAVAMIRRARVLVETRKLKEEQYTAFQQQKTVKGADGSEQKAFGYATLPVSQRLFPELDEEPSDRGIGGSTGDRGRPLFFDLSVNQCASLVQNRDGTEPIDDTNVRGWSFKGMKVRDFLQVVFEAWSGVATVAEVFDAWPDRDPDVSVQDVAVTALFLAAAGYLNIFALRRSSIQLLLSLTYKGVLELCLQRENPNIDCRRSAEYARFIYKQTTGKVTNYSVITLMKTYQSWTVREKYAGMGTIDESPDLKLHIGVTEGELAEVRRILALRTSDLSSVIPDILQFEEQARERMNLGATVNSLSLADVSQQNRLIEANAPGKSVDVTKETIKLMLEYQRSLGRELGISLS